MNENQNGSVTVIVSDPSRSIGVIQSGILAGRNAEILDLSEQVKPGESIQVQLVSETNGIYQVRMAADEHVFFIDAAAMLMRLEQKIDTCQKELQRIEEKASHKAWEAVKRKNQNVQSINNQIQQDLKKHEKDKLDVLNLIEERKQRFYRMEEVVQNTKNRVTSSGLIRKGNTAACFDKTDRSRRDIDSVFGAMRDLNSAYYDERMQDVIDRGDWEKLQEERKLADNLQKIAADKDRAVEDFEKRVSDGLNRQYNGERARRHSASARALRYSPAGYRSPEALPPAILLGDAVLDLSEFPSDLVKQHAETELSACLKNDEIRLPLTADTTKNYSLLIEHDRESRDYAVRQLSLILENMFYSYPGGRLEATLIDPLNTGSSFVDILRFGATPSTQRLINDKAWSSTLDINRVLSGIQEKITNRALSGILEKITNHISNCGDDHSSQMEKEPTIVLAITDFPEHFDNAGFQILHTIVGQAQSGGVIVLIDADKELLKGVMEKNSDCKKVVEMLTGLDATGNRLVFKNSQFGRCCFEPDQLLDVDDMARKRMAEEVIQQANRDMVPVRFAEMFDFDIFDENNWFKGSKDSKYSIHIPLGTRGFNIKTEIDIERENQYVMIEGCPAFGITTLLRTLIMSALLNYSPEDLQIYLLDCTYDWESTLYRQYTLPNLHAFTIRDKDKFERKFFYLLYNECRKRLNKLQLKKFSYIEEYNEICLTEGRPQNCFPRILIIFNDINGLFNENSAERDGDLSFLKKLVSVPHGLNIHFVLISDNFSQCPDIEWISRKAAIRIALRDPRSGSSSILEPENRGIEILQSKPPGTAIYNDRYGEEFGNKFFKIAILETEELEALLRKLEAEV